MRIGWPREGRVSPVIASPTGRAGLGRNIP
jgi:hypothetical protein